MNHIPPTLVYRRLWQLLVDQVLSNHTSCVHSSFSIGFYSLHSPFIPAIVIARLFHVALVDSLSSFATSQVGFGHATSHATWTHVCENLSLPLVPESTLPYQYSPSGDLILEPKSDQNWQVHGGSATAGVEDREVYMQHALRLVNSWTTNRNGCWIRPGCDGMVISTSLEGVSDDIY